jgi:hypothetical protein
LHFTRLMLVTTSYTSEWPLAGPDGQGLFSESRSLSEKRPLYFPCLYLGFLLLSRASQPFTPDIHVCIRPSVLEGRYKGLSHSGVATLPSNV